MHGRFVFVPDSLVDEHDGCYRAQMEGIATEDVAAVTWRKCLDLLYKRAKEENGH